jgi:hypothetical protein
MTASASAPIVTTSKLPAPVRWGAIIWLVVWVPAYWHAWGPANFVHLCDLAVFLTCLGLWSGNRLLLASQAVSSILVDFGWMLDAGWALFAGRHLIGGTEYLFDAHIALWIRLLSLFHIVLPPLLLWALWRTGYDRRAWTLQTGIALAAFIAARFTNPVTNINFAFRDPFWHRTWGPAPVHVALSVAALAIGLYLPTHLVLLRVYRSRGDDRP